MPNLPSSPRGSVPTIGDAACEALLAGNLPPADAERGMLPLAEAIAALTVAPSARELAGEPDARAAYRGGFTRPVRAPRPGTPRPGTLGAGARRSGHRRIRVPVSVLSVKLAVAAALAAVVAAGGLTAAAYTGVLPASVQSFAHRAVGAPAPHLEAPAGQPVAPSGPAPAPPGVYGLCHAYEHAKANSRGLEKAAAFRKLAAAAGGAARVKAYCAAATHPGKAPPGHQAGHHRGHPSAASAHPPAGHGASKPASHPSHPVSHPGHPGSKPDRHRSHRPGRHQAGKPGRPGA